MVKTNTLILMSIFRHRILKDTAPKFLFYKALYGGKKGRKLKRATHFPTYHNKDNDNNNNNMSNVFNRIIILHVFQWWCEVKTSHRVFETYRRKIRPMKSRM